MTDVEQVLTVAFRHVVSEPNIEAGFDRFRSLVPEPMGCAAFCEAIASCQRKGLIHEPIRLPEGALQCHWHLELTPKGVAAARALRKMGEVKQIVQDSCTLC